MKKESLSHIIHITADGAVSSPERIHAVKGSYLEEWFGAEFDPNTNVSPAIILTPHPFLEGECISITEMLSRYNLGKYPVIPWNTIFKMFVGDVGFEKFDPNTSYVMFVEDKHGIVRLVNTFRKGSILFLRARFASKSDLLPGLEFPTLEIIPKNCHLVVPQH